MFINCIVKKAKKIFKYDFNIFKIKRGPLTTPALKILIVELLVMILFVIDLAFI